MHGDHHGAQDLPARRCSGRRREGTGTRYVRYLVLYRTMLLSIELVPTIKNSICFGAQFSNEDKATENVANPKCCCFLNFELYERVLL